MEKRVPIGVSDFRRIREDGLEYVDKSHLIRELLDDRGSTVTLLPRPRRFGKTLNLSMLRCFFEKRDEDLSHLFEGLSIAAAGEEHRRHFQRYPVIHLTFKDTKAETWERGWEAIRRKIASATLLYTIRGPSSTTWRARTSCSATTGSRRAPTTSCTTCSRGTPSRSSPRSPRCWRAGASCGR